MVVSLTTCVLGLTIAAVPADAPPAAHAELRGAIGETDDAKALERIEALRVRYPAWEMPRLEAAEVMLRRGDSLDKIEGYLEGARVYAPENPRVHYLWGLLLMERGQVEAAAKAFGIALLIRQDYDEARLRLAAALMSLGRFDEAAEAYKVVAAHQPEATAVKLGWAAALEKAGKKPEAVAVLKGLMAGPAKLAAARKLSEIYRGQGKNKEADAVMKGLEPGDAKRKLRPLKPSRR
ncbi:MAG: tetratricopeptide repeat protein [Myxococcaceae bacterium]